MSNSIDRRVVEMVFDNSRFESNAQTTMGTLERLKQSLKFTEGTRAFENVSEAAGSVDLSPIESALSAVSDRFSVFGIAGATVIHSLTEKAIELGSELIGAINAPLAQIKSGGLRRALNLEQAKFQLKGLGIAWDDVSDSIDAAVNGTRFGLDSAAKAASQLAASNVQLGDEMTSALKGISGVAAMTNAEYDEIAHIFTRVAGNGRLFAIDLQSISSRGLNAAAKLAEYFREVKGQANVTEASIREMTSKGKIDFKTFADAMNWAFGEQATKANETFTGALANTKAALSRIGAEFYIPGLEFARNIFVDLIPRINNVKKAILPLTQTFSKFVSVFTWGKKNTDIHKIFNTIERGIKNITAFIPYFKNGLDVARQAIFGFDKSASELAEYMPKRFKKLTKGLNAESTEMSQLLKAMNITKVIEEANDSLKKFFKSIKPGKTTLRNFAGTISGIVYFIDLLVITIGKVLYVISPITGLIRRIMTFGLELGNALGVILGQVIKVYDGTHVITYRLRKIVETVVDFLIDKINWLSEKLNVFLDIFKSDWLGTGKFLEVIGKINGIFNSLIDYLHSFIDYLRPTDETIQNIKDTAIGLVSLLSLIWKGLKNIFGSISIDGSILGKLIILLRSLVSAFFSITGAIGRFFTELNETGKASKTFARIFEFIKAIFHGLKTVIGATIAAITDGVNAIRGKASDNLGEFMDKMKSGLEDLSPLAQKITGAFAILGQGIGDFFKNLGGAFANGSAGKILTLIGSGAFAGAFANMFLKINNVIKTMGLKEIAKRLGPVSAFSEFINEMRFTLSAMQQTLRAEQLMQIAKALLVLSAAVLVLSLIDPVRLTSATVAVTFMFEALFTSLQKIGKGTGVLQGFGTGYMIQKIAIAMLILAGAVYVLSKIDPLDLTKGLAAIGALFFMLSKFLNYLVIGSKGTKAAASTFVSLSIALLLISVAVKKLGELPLEVLGKGLLAIMALLFSLGAFMKFSGVGSSGAKGAFVILALAIALNLLYVAIRNIGGLDWETLAKGLIGIFLSLASMAAFLTMFSGFQGSMFKMGAMLLLVSVAMLIMGKAIKSMGSMSWEQLSIGMIALAGALAMLAVALNFMKGTLGGSAALLVASVALMVLANVIKVLGTLPTEVITTAILALAAALGVLGVAALVLGPLAPSMMLVAVAVALLGVGLLAAGAGIAMFCASVIAFAGSSEVLVKAIINIAKAIGIAVVEGLDNFIKALDKTLPSIVETAYDILKTFIKTIGENISEIVTLGMDIVTNFLKGVTQRLPELVDAAVDFIVTFIESLADSLDKNKERIEDAVVKLVASIIHILIGSIVKLAKAGWDMIVGLKDSFEEHYPEAAEALKNLPKKIVEKIKEKFSLLLDIGKDIVHKILEGIKKVFGIDIEDFFKKLPERVANLIKEGWEKLKEAGAHLINGLIKGLESRNTEVEAAVNNTAKIVNKKFTKTEEIQSPSKVWMKYGRYLIDGLIIGLRDRDSSLRSAASDTAMVANRAFGHALDILENDDYAPTITPVVDLSNVYQSADKMNGIFNNPSLIPQTGLNLTGSIGEIRPGSSLILDASSNLEKAQSAMAETLGKLINDGLLDAQAVYDAVRMGASMADIRVNLNDRELSRGLRGMGVVFR